MWWFRSLSIRMLKKLLGGIRDGRISTSQVIPSLIIITAEINGKQIEAMIDTGATISIVSQSVLTDISHFNVDSINFTATLGDGRTKIHATGTTELLMKINGLLILTTVLVVECLGAPLILGMDWCTRNNVSINIAKRMVEINPKD